MSQKVCGEFIYHYMDKPSECSQMSTNHCIKNLNHFTYIKKPTGI